MFDTSHEEKSKMTSTKMKVKLRQSQLWNCLLSTWTCIAWGWRRTGFVSSEKYVSVSIVRWNNGKFGCFFPSFFSEVLAPEIGKAQSSHWGCHAFERPSSSSSSSSSLLQSPTSSAKSNQKNHWTVKKKGQNVTIWRHCNMQRFPSTFNIQQPGKFKKKLLISTCSLTN